MNQAGTPELTPMGKVQKTLMIPEDLYSIVQAVELQSGAPFVRIAIASLLAWLFHGLRSPGQEGFSLDLDSYWIRLAVLIERGEIKVPDLPEEILDSVIEDAERAIGAFGREETKQILKLAKDWKTRWPGLVEDYGGKMEAIIEKLTK